MYRNFFKRIIDIFAATFALIALLPLLIILMFVLMIANKSTNIFFVQARVGKNNHNFKVLKFKTMTDEKDADGNLLPDVLRITKIGGLIRSLSFDELPQLINVIKGDMSLIGPRPLLGHYLPLYSERQALRHRVRPGITGWAQINGRNAISWQEKFELDVFYVENISLNLDLKIFFLTIKKVFIREGVNAADDLSMQEFKGN